MKVSNVGRAVGITESGVSGLILANGAITPATSYGAIYAELSTSWAIAIAAVFGAAIVATEPPIP